MTEPILPTLAEGLLDGTTFARYAHEVATLGTHHVVRAKGSATTHADAATLDLASALTAMEDGGLRAVQIRYVWSDQHWCDTLMRLPTGIRLVRIRLDDVAP